MRRTCLQVNKTLCVFRKKNPAERKVSFYSEPKILIPAQKPTFHTGVSFWGESKKIPWSIVVPTAVVKVAVELVWPNWLWGILLGAGRVALWIRECFLEYHQYIPVGSISWLSKVLTLVSFRNLASFIWLCFCWFLVGQAEHLLRFFGAPEIHPLTTAWQAKGGKFIGFGLSRFCKPGVCFWNLL